MATTRKSTLLVCCDGSAREEAVPEMAVGRMRQVATWLSWQPDHLWRGVAHV